MDLEETVKTFNEFVREVDRTSGHVDFKPGEKVAFTNLTYQGLRVEVGLGKNDDETIDVLVSVSLVPSPKKNREAFFKQLLRWNNFTSGYGHFSLGNDENSVFMVTRRPMINLQKDEFVAMVANMASNSFGTLQAVSALLK